MVNESPDGRPACAHLDFLIIGAMKAGTTSLFDFLCGQPGVFELRNKEPHYFSRGYRLPVSYYRWTFRKAAPGQLKGEASPSYSDVHKYPDCARRIWSDAPQVKLIFLVRDPIERIVSHFHHHELLGMEEEQLAEALTEERFWNRSRYVDTVDAYLEYFPPEQLLVLDFDRLRTEPAGLATALEFLDLPVTEPLELPRSYITDERDAVPAVIGSLAQTTFGSLVRDFVPRARIQSMKRLISKPGTLTEVDADTVRAIAPEPSAEVDAQYRELVERFGL